MKGLWRVGLLYSALTIALAYPLSIHPGSAVLSATPDTNLFLWTLQWDVHALTHQPLAIFDANIYYPERHTLAYSENLLGSAPMAAPVLWLTGNAVLAMNLIVLIAAVLCGLGTYVLARQLGIGPLAAALSGLVFAFSPPRFLRLDQLHLATIEWIPFGLASLHAYWDTGRARDLRIAIGLFALQALASGHGAVFLLVAVAVLVLWRVAIGASRLSTAWLDDVGVSGAAFLLTAGLVLLPYRTVQQAMGLRRSLEDWAVPWQSFLASPSHMHVALLSLAPSWRINESAGPTLFPGVIPILLAAVALVPGRKGRGPFSAWRRLAVVCDLAALAGAAAGTVVAASGMRRLTIGAAVVTIRQPWRPWIFAALAVAARVAILRNAPFDSRARRLRQALRVWRDAARRSARAPYALITAVALLLAAGPPISLWPLVYWLPGLNFIRAPSRFMLLAILGLAILAGFGFDRLAGRLSAARRRWLAVGVGTLIVAEFVAAPLAIEPYAPDPPAIDHWLATLPAPRVIAEIPVGNPRNLGEWEGRESTFMLHSTAHWQKTVHGYSGFRSPLHEALYAAMTTFPDATSLGSLTDLGVTDVVVHTDWYPPGEWAAVEKEIAGWPDRLAVEHVDGAGRVYALRRPR